MVDDLHERGLDKDVTVLVWGEFGRTPKINPRAGRDHWPRVHAALHRLRGVDPERFTDWPATVTTWRTGLGREPVLPALRALAADVLHELPAPLGFSHRRVRGGESPVRFQHPMGPDPPQRNRSNEAVLVWAHLDAQCAALDFYGRGLGRWQARSDDGGFGGM